MKKYSLVKNDFVFENGVKLYRIKALRSFSNVNKGDIGGYVESLLNLSQYDDCWVYDDAKVYEYAIVYDNAEVKHNAKVYGEAYVSYEAYVSDRAIVTGYSYVSGRSIVCDNAQMKDNSIITCEAVLRGSAILTKASKLEGRAIVDTGTLTRSPIYLTGLTLPVTITPFTMRIGFKQFTHNQWAKKSDREINLMSNKALDFWKTNKEFLLSICNHEALLEKEIEQ